MQISITKVQRHYLFSSVKLNSFTKYCGQAQTPFQNMRKDSSAILSKNCGYRSFRECLCIAFLIAKHLNFGRLQGATFVHTYVDMFKPNNQT